MKGSKPPPPVPPRPSKSLIREALAKTRQAHGTCITSVKKNDNHEQPTIGKPPQLPPNKPQDYENNNRITLNGHPVQKIHKSSTVTNIYENHTQLKSYSARPVIYQSENCKSRLVRTESKNSSEMEKNLANKDINSLPTSKNNNIRLFESLSRKFSGQHCPENEDVLRIREDNKEEHKPKEHCSSVVSDTCEAQNIGTKVDDNDPLTNSALREDTNSKTSDRSTSPENNKSTKNWEDLLNNRNHVNTLIDEMFASVLEVNLSSSTSPSSSTENVSRNNDNNKITISNSSIPSDTCSRSNSDDNNLTVIVVNETNPSVRCTSEPREIKDNTSSIERKVKFSDQQNHEFLINELQNMKHQEERLSKQSLSSLKSDEDDCELIYDDSKIHMNDWYGVNDGKKVRMSSCHIKIDDPFVEGEDISTGYQKIKDMSQSYGLPPLPKSLSGFKFLDNSHSLARKDSISSNKKTHVNKKEETNGLNTKKEMSTLDRQLATLRREMNSLREQDLSLLLKLWFLNESIQDFRQMLQEQEDKINLTLAPSPTPSSIDDDEFYVITTSTC